MKGSRPGGESAQQLLTFGKESIPFEVDFSPRRTLKITVRPDLRVVVAAPAGRTVEDVVHRVRRRASWIAKQRAYFARFLPAQPPRQYVAGETHLYLGRQVRLKLVAAEEESVKLLGRYLVVSSPLIHESRVGELVEGWRTSHGRKVITGRLEKCLDRVRTAGVSRPTVRFQRMERRWGSCSRKGTIVLNTELCKASVPCIDYVLFHELCHLKYPSHGKEFYRFLARFVPDWRRWKERLEQVNL